MKSRTRVNIDISKILLKIYLKAFKRKSLLDIATMTDLPKCFDWFMSDCMVGKLDAPENANIVVLKAKWNIVVLKAKWNIRKRRCFIQMKKR